MSLTRAALGGCYQHVALHHNEQGARRAYAAMSRHRLFYFTELQQQKAARGLFPSLSWRCYRVEWQPGQQFHDTCLDVGDAVIEVWQDKFVLVADPGGVEYDAGQIDELMAARFKKRLAEAASDTSASRNAGGEAGG